MTRRAWVALATAAFLSATAWAADGGTRLLRFPDIHGDTVVFCYGGDLWSAPADGGTARRLTAHPGQEVFPRFSPDGRWIAFTGQYDGDEQVYVMPADGGEPRRLTWYPAAGPLPPRWGYDHQVFGWTRDGSAVLFRSLRDAGGDVDGRLYTVPVEGGLPTALPMPNSGAGDFSPDGERVVYSPLFRDFRHWKRYQGGWAQDLWIFDLASAEVTPLAHSPRTERDPMWIGDAVYFVSDRDDRLNLFAADPAGGEVEQLTFHDPWDVRWPATDHVGRIVYELDGRLRVFDVASRDDRAIEIAVPDDGLWKRERRIKVADLVEGFGLSPKGERALFTARGEVFSAPVESGRTRNLTRSSGARDRDAEWSPDGRTIAYISDASGEDEVWLVDQDGGEPARQLTSGHRARLTGLTWSPDAKRIAVTDVFGRLFVVTVADGSETEVADDILGRIGDAAWSPDSGHLAVSLNNEAGVRRIHIWSAASGELRQVTSDLHSSSDPAWGPDGDYLFYISERSYAPQISNLEWDYAGNRRDNIFALALRADVKPLFPPESDEVEVGDDGDKKKNEDADKADKKKKKKNGGEDGDDEAKKEAPKPVVIDFDGLAARVMRVPVPNGNYGGLAAVEGHLLWASFDAFVYGGDFNRDAKLEVFSLEDREVSVLASGIRGASLSADGSKVLVQAGGAYKLYDVGKGGGEPKSVATSDLEMTLDPPAEWRQIYDETWRIFRDLFYVENMHGYDWQALGERYRALLDHVAHRSDLNYVLTEMVAELNAGHTYLGGGDFEIPKRPVVGLPGARFELDEAAGRYRLAAIFPGHNEEEQYRSPLTEVGIDAGAGDYVLAIDGRELSGSDNPYRLLQHLDTPVTLTVNDSPSLDGAREVTYSPRRSESPLLYLAWVLRNHQRVTELSDGRLGYLHVPDMGPDGLAEFIKWYYPQLRKQGLVVDVRSNGGGNVSAMLLERLGRTILGTRFGRTSEIPGTYPGTVFLGPMACLISETSASDGDIFPHYFRQAGLGPLIGRRTWGGVVGGGFIPLIDGGTVFVPTNATNNLAGDYIIEGRGVEPDIEVANEPAAVLAGRDPQLERAVAELLAAIEAEPVGLPERPADPVKTPGAR
ncbi:MAG TPA: S41 family peptidase [Candidatus Sulfomarinibacteraceae bacterium]|nr:S41 family peptidase [Candidatus Sulfomarinibacteraceae bacterium]